MPILHQRNDRSGAARFVSKKIGGSQVQGISTGQSGAAPGLGNAIFLAVCTTFRCPKTSVWWTAGSTLTLVLTAIPPANISSRDSLIKEGTQLQFRAEAIKAFNHPQFTAPNTTPTSNAFGTVTGEFTWPRVIQFGLELLLSDPVDSHPDRESQKQVLSSRACSLQLATPPS